jgi:O-acetylserine/cysteine efflux transporter
MARPGRTRASTAIAQLFFAAALWGGATTGTKYALRGFGPVTLLAMELVAAALALAIAVRVRGGVRGTVPSWRLAATLGLLEPATAYLSETIGLQRTSAANAAVILGLESCFVVLLAAIFLRERINGPLAFAVLSGFAGLAILEGSGWLSGPGVGDALVISGTFSAAVYVIVARRMDDTVDAMLLTLRQFTIAVVAVVPLALVGWASGREAVPTSVPPPFWIAAALVGISGYGVSFLLYNNAIVVVEAGPAAVVINLIPAFGVLSAVGLLGERLGAHQILGALLLTASVAVFGYRHLRPRRQALRPPVQRNPKQLQTVAGGQPTSAL